ncbi:MAG: diguanylate cyclase [Vampirovibrionales bacterium]|nr:diguanylate cyclase [Vampirovibrionales bacterium]
MKKTVPIISDNLSLGLRLSHQWMAICAISWVLYWGLFFVLLPSRVPNLGTPAPHVWLQLLCGIGLATLFGIICWFSERPIIPKTMRVTPPLSSVDDAVNRSHHIEQGGRLAWSVFAIFSLQYALSGGWLGFALAPIAAIGLAFYLGLNRLAVRLGVAYSILMLIGIQFGWPTLTPFSGQNVHLLKALEASTLCAILLTVSLIPTLALFIQFGSAVTLYVKATVEQTIRLLALVATDALTGLANRGLFNKRLMSEFARARRYHQPFCLAMVDIDNFKRLNDQYGHLIGDAVLKELGQLLAQNVRESDLPARYGGEEFALILPQTVLQDASDLLERIRQMISRRVFCAKTATPLQMTVSVGIAQLDVQSNNASDIVAAADAALYQAKRTGRNRVVLSPNFVKASFHSATAANVQTVSSKSTSVLPPVL